VELKNKREPVVGRLLLLTLVLLTPLLILVLGRRTESVVHGICLLGTRLLGRHLLRLILQHPH
jgi:hypothetical protein